ncbi:MAG: M20/M25/M40 family metallo-hydrolase [Candidatus Neomarinimicrobiota bacterium]
MKLVKITLVLLYCWSCAPLTNLRESQEGSEITESEILEHIRYLASDDLKGRSPGTEGSEMAISYIIQEFERAGLKPGGSDGFRQPFEIVLKLNIGEGNTLYLNGENFEVESDFIPLGFSENGRVEAGVIFGGYGFSINDSIQWNDYAGLDAEGKWVMVLRGGPDGDNPHSAFEAHAPLRKKALVARDNKAGGILFVSPPGWEDDDLIPLRYDQSFSGAGIPAIHISTQLAAKILSPAGKSLKSLQDALENSRAPQSLTIDGSTVAVAVNLIKETAKVPNIIGIIPGQDPVLKDEYIILGAHFDHLGFGGKGSSSLEPGRVEVHNGADDNASGVTGLLELAEKLSANHTELKRSVVFMAYNAEEKGLLGSKYFVKNPTIDIKSIITMINMDMIGRMKDKKITIGGTGTAPRFDNLIKEINQEHGLAIKTNSEGYGPSDHASFYIKDIPVLFFFTGIHNDYHKPTDDWMKINIEGEIQILEFIHDLTISLLNAREKPQFTEAGPKERPSGRRRFKVTFGVIPSYSSQAEGMEIDGTRAGGPAETAGMQSGDIIIEIDGQEIKNIYDYMYRLGDLKKGQIISVKVRRGEEILDLVLAL